MADIALASPVVHKAIAGLELDTFPNVLAWYDRMAAFDWWQQALPKAPASA